MSVEELRALLDERARRLSARVDQTAAVPTVELLVVVAGGSRYAVETRHVREVLRAPQVRRLPAGSAWLRGLVPARGEVVPVADLAELLDRPASGRTSYAVVIDGPAPPVGLLVDEAVDVVDVPADRLGAGAAGPTQPARLELGVADDGIVVLDALTLLNDPRLTVPRRSTPATASPDGRQET